MRLKTYKINIIYNFQGIKLYKKDPDFEMIENINLNTNVNHRSILIIKKYIMKLLSNKNK